MKTVKLDWVNGRYNVVKSSLPVAHAFGKGPFGFLSMQEIASWGRLNDDCNMLGYWESPRGLLTCTFQIERFAVSLPYMFMPVRLVVWSGKSLTASTLEYDLRRHIVIAFAQKDKRKPNVPTGSRIWRRLFQGLNAPLMSGRVRWSSEIVEHPLDEGEEIPMYPILHGLKKAGDDKVYNGPSSNAKPMYGYREGASASRVLMEIPNNQSARSSQAP